MSDRGGSSQPVAPLRTASRRPGTSRTNAGTPWAAASSTATPQPSRCEALRKIHAWSRMASRSASLTRPWKTTAPSSPSSSAWRLRFSNSGTVADDVEDEIADAAPRLGDSDEQLVDMLLHDEAADAHHRGAGRGRSGAGPRRRTAVGHHVDRSPEAQVATDLEPGRGRHRDGRSATVDPAAGRTLEEATDARQALAEVQFELLLVHMVDEQHDRNTTAHSERREEGQPVLAIEDRVDAAPAPEPADRAGEQQPQQHEGIGRRTGRHRRRMVTPASTDRRS